MIGKVLDKLDRTGYASDTIIALVGDHGNSYDAYIIGWSHLKVEVCYRVFIG